MADGFELLTHYGEAFWRAHLEARRGSTLNQREYCELHGLPQRGPRGDRMNLRAEKPTCHEPTLLTFSVGLISTDAA
jgi:hypothetical protein